MAAQHLTFEADVDRWVLETKQRTLAVFREAAQRTVSEAQQRVPVDTGFLRASIRASDTPGVPVIDNTTGKTATWESGSITLAIANMDTEKPLYVMYGASYAAAVEFGTSKMAPRAFVQMAAMNWPQHVREATAERRNARRPLAIGTAGTARHDRIPYNKNHDRHSACAVFPPTGKDSQWPKPSAVEHSRNMTNTVCPFSTRRGG